jgi:hypothetical protein
VNTSDTVPVVNTYSIIGSLSYPRVSFTKLIYPVIVKSRDVEHDLVRSYMYMNITVFCSSVYIKIPGIISDLHIVQIILDLANLIRSLYFTRIPTYAFTCSSDGQSHPFTPSTCALTSSTISSGAPS